MKKINKFLYCISFIIYLFILLPNYCIAKENIQIFDAAMNAMKINACAIKTGEDILCVVKDATTANNVITAFYFQYAKCNNNEVLVEITWAKKPEIVNIKENIFNIVGQDEAINKLIYAVDKTDVKVAAFSVARDAYISNTLAVAYTKYVKESELTEFETIVEFSDTLYQEQSQIKQKGIQGVKENIYKIVYINDTEQSRELVKSKELIKSKNQIIIKGKKARIKPEYDIHANGFVSSVYGDRNGEMHLGIDIANSKDTEIRASKDGEVVRVEWYYG